MIIRNNEIFVVDRIKVCELLLGIRRKASGACFSGNFQSEGFSSHSC